MHLRNEKRYSADDYNHVPRKRRQPSTKEDLHRAKIITTQNEESPLFSCLPRELRDMVWEHAFGSDETRFEYRNLAIVTSNLNYTYCDEQYDGVPEWLLSCKTILGEALDVFYRTQTYAPATIHRISRSIPSRQYHRLSMKLCQGRAPVNPIDRSEYKNPLLFNKGIKNVDIVSEFNVTWPTTTETSRPYLYFMPDEVSDMFVRYLQNLRLKDMKLTCELHLFGPSCCWVQSLGKEESKVKRNKGSNSKLEDLRGCCRNLTVVVDTCMFEIRNRVDRNEVDRVIAKVEAWAKSIVGKDAKVEVRDGRGDMDHDGEGRELKTIRVWTRKS